MKELLKAVLRALRLLLSSTSLTMLKTLTLGSTLLASTLLVAGEPSPFSYARRPLADPAVSSAHPGEEHHAPTGAELARRSQQATKRTSVASKCANHVGANKRARRAKRAAEALKKRDIDASSLTTAEYKGYSTIQNSSCVTAPEVTEGPCESRLVGSESSALTLRPRSQTTSTTSSFDRISGRLRLVLTSSSTLASSTSARASPSRTSTSKCESPLLLAGIVALESKADLSSSYYPIFPCCTIAGRATPLASTRASPPLRPRAAEEEACRSAKACRRQ
jgi:hypothetical protein